MAPNTSTSIMVDSGLYFDFLAPAVGDVVLDDIAHSSGATVRFNGHLRRLVTTGEHMARVGRIAHAIAPRGFEAESRFLGHIHDAHETYTPWGDCLRPGKTAEMREVEAKIDAVIFRRLLGRDWQPSDQAQQVVKTADNLALYFEAMLWQRRGADWAPHVLSGAVDSGQLTRLLPLIWPRHGESLTEAITSNRWVGEAWLRELWRIWPSNLKPDAGDWARSNYIQWDQG
jgi:hypothetical protein